MNHCPFYSADVIHFSLKKNQTLVLDHKKNLHSTSKILSVQKSLHWTWFFHLYNPNSPCIWICCYSSSLQHAQFCSRLLKSSFLQTPIQVSISSTIPVSPVLSTSIFECAHRLLEFFCRFLPAHQLLLLSLDYLMRHIPLDSLPYPDSASNGGFSFDHSPKHHQASDFLAF